MKNEIPVEIRIVRKAGRAEIIALYKEAGWWKPDYSKDTSFIDRIVKKTYCFAGAFHKNKMIGMGRGISDGCSDAYIQDVVVLKKYRGHGIGAGIIREIVEHLQSDGIDWIALVAEPGTEKFYGSLGFRSMKKHIPMLLKHTPPVRSVKRGGRWRLPDLKNS
ncbi:MAG: GNAT family N-acetyltransferase [Victivallales bacterium]